MHHYFLNLKHVITVSFVFLSSNTTTQNITTCSNKITMYISPGVTLNLELVMMFTPNLELVMMFTTNIKLFMMFTPNLELFMMFTPNLELAMMFTSNLELVKLFFS